MAHLSIQDQQFQIEAVVFDKDGTLIDFDHIWGKRTHQAVDTLMAHLGENSSLRDALFASWGYDPATRRTVADGPLAVASTAKLYTIAAAVLYQHGYGWERSERYIREIFAPVMLAPLSAEMIRPLGDVSGLFRQLHAAGVGIAVATADDRAATEATLQLLNVRDMVGLLICGDDELPNKPDPEGMRRAAAHFNTTTEKMMMVGDTVSDMLFGRNAQVACCAAIAAGAGDHTALRQHADLLIHTVDEIEVSL